MAALREVAWEVTIGAGTCSGQIKRKRMEQELGVFTISVEYPVLEIGRKVHSY